MEIDDVMYLIHYGIKRRSGRYPWGSGGDDAQVSKRNKEFLDYVSDLRKQGLSDAQIAEGLGMSSTDLRGLRSAAKEQQKQAEITLVQRLKEKGMSNVAIASQIGKNESYVRTLLKDGEAEKAQIIQSTADMLRRQVDEKKYIDVGSGVEQQLNLSDTKLKAALSVLKEEGYSVFQLTTPQLGAGDNKTNLKVLVGPNVTYKEAAQNKDNIQQIFSYTQDSGRSWFNIVPPLSIHPDRVKINYAEDGGAKADGVIFVRPNVPDVSLGGANYAQVRIQVGDGHYLKGMAMYKDNLPAGADLVFNTNKSNTGNKLDAMKQLSQDPDNPFGAQISRQIAVHDKHGKEHATSVMNIVNEEGTWGEWSKNLSSQMLSKQSPKLAKEQLNLAYEQRVKEFEELSNLTNPAIKKKLLLEFGDGCDSAAVHLKAANLPRQATHVILPIDSMPPTQVYAPNYNDGERVVLIRHPHGGRFEIPELTVNNKNKEARAAIGPNAKDAIGIHHSVAERLSGADFDGDTVIVIPNNHGKVQTTAALEELRNFDPRALYKGYEGMPKMSAKRKQTEMGKVSNLITDMTIKQAPLNEIARAVRHSMVVIDAEKHDLNYRQSEIDHGIAQLKEKYQGGKNKGASTLISRAASEEAVPQRKERPQSEGGAIDPATGKRVYVPTNASYTKTTTNKKGDVKTTTVFNKTFSTKLAEAEDAFSLSSGTPMESLYAEHSNKLKALANRSRKDALATPNVIYSSSANKAYAKEVSSLNAKLAIAKMNRPLERQAQILANMTVKAKVASEPDMDAAQLKKVKSQALNAARHRTGAKKDAIKFEGREWEAIQAGAIHHTTLLEILANADVDHVKELATPRQQTIMTPNMTRRAKSMFELGATRAEVAAQLGVSLTTLDNTLKREEG